VTVTLFRIPGKNGFISRDGVYAGIVGNQSRHRREFHRRGNRVTVTVFSVLFLLVVPACGGPAQTPEERIRGLVARAEQAAEDRDLSVFKDSVSGDYRDSRGYNRDNVLRLIQGMLLRNQQIHLLSLVRDVQVQEGAAQARVLVAMAGRPIESAEALVNLRAELMRFDVAFQRQGDEWLVRSVDWKRAEVQDFL